MPAHAAFTSYAQHTNATITVTNSSELHNALASLGTSGGGTILVDPNGGPYNISANGVGDANNPILIKSLDPAHQPLVQNITLINASYITMTDMHVDSSAQPVGVQDLRITNGDHIEFVNNTMTSTANGYLDGSANINQGANAALIRNSHDINFSGNTVANYAHGVQFLEVSNLNFGNNELSGLQMDGFRAGGLQNANISNNYMHDFNGSIQTINHPDFIQIWSTNAQMVTSNVQINGNVLDTNGHAAYQGIFIGNEGMRGPNPTGHYYDNIRIFDNVVHTATYHGISVESAQNTQIYNNKVLFDDQSHYRLSPSSSWDQVKPFILLSNAPNSSAHGNEAGKVIVNGVQDQGGQNHILNFNDPATTQYINGVMANLSASAGTIAPSTPASGGSTPPSGTPQHPVSDGTDTAANQHPAQEPPATQPDQTETQDSEPAHPAPANDAPAAEQEQPDLPDSGNTDDEPVEIEQIDSPTLLKVYHKTVDTVVSKFGFAGNGSDAEANGAADQISMKDIAALMLPPADDLPPQDMADDPMDDPELALHTL